MDGLGWEFEELERRRGVETGQMRREEFLYLSEIFRSPEIRERNGTGLARVHPRPSQFGQHLRIGSLGKTEEIPHFLVYLHFSFFFHMLFLPHLPYQDRKSPKSIDFGPVIGQYLSSMVMIWTTIGEYPRTPCVWSRRGTGCSPDCCFYSSASPVAFRHSSSLRSFIRWQLS